MRNKHVRFFSEMAVLCAAIIAACLLVSHFFLENAEPGIGLLVGVVIGLCIWLPYTVAFDPIGRWMQ